MIGVIFSVVSSLLISAHYLRGGNYAMVPFWILSLGLSFGLICLGLMIFWSRRVAAMTHCVTYCPIGLLSNFMGRVSPFRMKINDKCNDCGACSLACRYDALSKTDILARRPGFSCALCGDCIPRCHEGSIGYRIFLFKSTSARINFTVMAVALHAACMAVARI